MKIRPVATYRLQFRDGMTFDRAVEILPYLKRLGISHLYASPIFRAVGGSTHGYDVTDHNRIDPVLGGEEGFERLHAALRGAGMGLILDIVPNHMAASLENPWWRSVVELGTASPFAAHFDIDWRERLTLPILGRDFRDVLAAGELSIEADAGHGCLALAYFDNRLPLHPASYRTIAERLDEPGTTVLGEIADLAAAASRTGASFHDAMRTFLASEDAAHLPDALAKVSRDSVFLERLHDEQPWRLTFWKDARRHLGYRRFFEVTGLVGMCVEDDAVFDDVHRLTLSLVRDGKVDGLRVDHVDGLARPGSYLERLRREAGPDVWILVEKILEENERLPGEWDCVTTGYEFIPALADLLVDANGQREMERAHERFVGRPIDARAELRRAKLLILRRNFQGELRRLATVIARAARQAGFGLQDLEDAIAEIILGFEVYRTYGERGALSADDGAVLARAVETATASGVAKAGPIAFVASLLNGEPAGEDASVFRLRFQQLTGPVMAKAAEDTLFYRLNPLIALNEVGASPGAAKGSVERFHGALRARAGHAAGLLATATHDTKRGEDARARLYALSEEPARWIAAVDRWSAMNRRFRRTAGQGPAPEPEIEWLLYQSLAGFWPPLEPPTPTVLDGLAERFLPYVEKALRETKLRTDWLAVDEDYERAVLDFARHLLSRENVAFLEDFTATLRPFIEAGAVNALSQTLAKLTAPGIPDIYQGSEVLDLSLVDPDNRRPVDFARLAARLEQRPQPRTLDREALLGGGFKQAMIASCLDVRRRNQTLFSNGDYEPVPVSGEASPRFAAFLRQHGDDTALVVLPRLTLQGNGGAGARAWVELPPAGRNLTFTNVLTTGRFRGSERLSLEAVMEGLPVLFALSDGG